jgi:hypothetical protein
MKLLLDSAFIHNQSIHPSTDKLTIPFFYPSTANSKQREKEGQSKL